MSFVNDLLKKGTEMIRYNTRFLYTLGCMNDYYESQLRNREKIIPLLDDMKKEKIYVVYCYLNVGTFKVYIGCTKEVLEDEKDNIESEFKIYQYMKKDKAQYKGSYDIELFRNMKNHIHDDDNQRFQIFGLLAFYCDNEKLVNLVQQYYIDLVKEEYEKGLINEEEKYVPNFREKYSNIILNNENNNVFNYAKRITDYEKEYDETKKISDFED